MDVVHRSINLSIPNGNVKFSEDGTSVTYHCADNFKLVGSASAVCELDGIWSSPPPKCIDMFGQIFLYKNFEFNIKIKYFMHS